MIEAIEMRTTVYTTMLIKLYWLRLVFHSKLPISPTLGTFDEFTVNRFSNIKSSFKTCSGQIASSFKSIVVCSTAMTDCMRNKSSQIETSSIESLIRLALTFAEYSEAKKKGWFGKVYSFMRHFSTDFKKGGGSQLLSIFYVFYLSCVLY